MSEPGGSGPNPNYPNGYPPPPGTGNYPPPANYPPPGNYPPTPGTGNYPPPANYPPPGTGSYPPPASYPPGTGSYPPPAQNGYNQAGPYYGNYPPPANPTYGYGSPPPRKSRAGLLIGLGVGLVILVVGVLGVLLLTSKTPGNNGTATVGLANIATPSVAVTAVPTTVATSPIAATAVPTVSTVPAVTNAPLQPTANPTATTAPLTSTEAAPPTTASVATTRAASNPTNSATVAQNSKTPIAPTSLTFLNGYPGAKPLTVNQSIKDLFAQSIASSAGKDVTGVKIDFYSTPDDQAKIFKFFQDAAKAKNLVSQLQNDTDSQSLIIADSKTNDFGAVVVIPADQVALLIGDQSGTDTIFIVITGKLKAA